MSDRKKEFFIGMMVIGVIAGVFLMTILFGAERGFFIGGKGGQRMTIVFQKGGGISQNSLVLKNGIKIGRVYSVELVDEVGRSEVHVSFELEPGIRIYSNEYAKINRTLLGDASIEFVDDPDYVGEVFEIGAGDVIPGRNTGDLMGTVSNIEGDLAQALQNINKASEGVTLFMQNINTILGDEVELEEKKERLQGVFSNLAETLESVNNLANNLNLIVSDEEILSNIRTTTAEAPALLKQINNLTNGAQDFMNNAHEIGEKVGDALDRAKHTFDLVDKNLDNVQVFTTSLAEEGPQMMTALNESSVEIKTTISSLHDTAGNISQLAATLNERLNDPDSTFGALADPETAKSLRHIVKNAEEISKKLYPILDDARVFSNKIAHRPSSLVWDKTTSKGGSPYEKFGMQSLSPAGGLSSPLYRQTPSGAKIRERNFYEPSADVDYMEPTTRAAYEKAVAELDGARAQNALLSRGRGDGLNLLPTVSTKGERGLFAGMFGRRSSERKERVRWSLASLWNSLQEEDAMEECDVVPVEAQALQPYSASFVGYDQYDDGLASVGQPIYEAVGADYGEIQDYERYDASPYDPSETTASLQSSECGISECGVPQRSECGVGCDVDCAPNCDLAPGRLASSITTGKGYDPNGGYSGGYTRPNNMNESVGQKPTRQTATGELGPYNPSNSDFDEPTQIEELPPTINRPASSTIGGDFEDDGLPLEFTPPSM